MNPEHAFPDYIMIQTVSGCNASCYFCPYPYLKNQIPAIKMSWKLFQKIIDECSQYKNVKVIVPYLMNEPLLDRELPEKISYIKERLPWVSIHILTNGSLLDEDFSYRLINSGLDWIGFSIQGIENSTIHSTMGLNSEKILKNVANFISLAGKLNKNISDFVMVTFIKSIYLSEGEKEKIFKFWKDRGITRISYYSAPISRAGNVPVLPSVNNQDIYGCNSIWTDDMFHILSDGTVVLCCMDWKREVVLGSISKESIFEIWNGRSYREVRKKIRGEIASSPDFICRRCECAQTTPVNVNLEKKIQLIMVPPWGVEVPPLGLGIIAEVLENSGYEVEVLDLNILFYNRVDKSDRAYWQMDSSLYWKKPEFISYLLKKYPSIFEDVGNILRRNKSPIVGFSLPTNCMNLMLNWVLEEIKSSSPDKMVVILGGVSVSIEEQRQELLRLLRDKVDVVIPGEGEETVVNLVDKFFHNKSINDLENVIVYKDNCEIRGKVKPLRDLNGYPLPTFKKFNLNLYQAKESLAVEWSRGCIGRCKFCDFKVLSKFYKKKSPERIVEELEFYHRVYGKKHFSLVDSSVNADLKWLEEICDLIIKNKNLDIKLTALAIPRGDISLSLLKKMKAAGFYRLEYGIESGCDEILKLMGKSFTSKEAGNALMQTKKAGIKNVVYFIVGYPGETESDFQETLKFIREHKEFIDFVKSVNPLYLMAGSELFENSEKYNIKLPSDNPDIYWYIEGENNFELRMARVKRIHNLLDELQINYTTEATALPEPKSLRKVKIETKHPEVAIVTTPPWGINNPPLSIAYLASFVRKSGYQPAVFDFNIEFYHYAEEGLKNLWHVENKNFWSNISWFPLLVDIFDSKIEEAVNKILETKAPLIGFSVVDPKERMTIEFIKRIKKKDPRRKIILGGPACLTPHSRKIFLDNIPMHIDYFVVGEGEKTLIDILKKKSGSIKGTVFKLNGIWEYLPRGLIEDLNQIPFPTYEDFDLALYPGKSLILEWSRGCTGKCAFCINHELVRGYRSRSAEHIFQELKYHTYMNKIRKFTICDPIINGNPKVLDKLSDLIIKEKMDIEWTGEAMPRRDMGVDILRKMRTAGCYKLQIGVESGSSKVLKYMRKAYTPEIAEEFIKKASLAGIETEVFIMIGFPGEGEREFEETINFLKRNREYINTIKSINTLHLIAGTDLYNNKEKYNIKPLPQENWHYLWETSDGNNYEIRKKRGEYLLAMAKQLGFKVMETNLKEGKQDMEIEPGYENLKILVNSLQDLPQKQFEKKLEPILPRKKILKLPYLILILALTVIAEIYLWALKKLRRFIIFPGS